MRKLSKKQKIAAAGTAAVVAVAGGGVAYAYWSTSGSGTGSATTADGAASLVISQTAAPTNLAPGVDPGAITGTVKNTATNNAHVNSITVSIASVTGGKGTCAPGDYALSGAVMTVNKDLAPNETTNFSGASLGFNNKTDTNQDGCQGATVNLAYAAS